jgi:hypothetical protein
MTDISVRAGTVAAMPGRPANPYPYAESPLLETVAGTGRLLKCCRSTVEKLIRTGQLESVHIGRRCMVKRRSILRLVGEAE